MTRRAPPRRRSPPPRPSAPLAPTPLCALLSPTARPAPPRCRWPPPSLPLAPLVRATNLQSASAREDAQRCGLRGAGPRGWKHNDVDVRWAFETQVDVVGIIKERLYVTYSGGNGGRGVDLEAKALWVSVLPAEGSSSSMPPRHVISHPCDAAHLLRVLSRCGLFLVGALRVLLSPTPTTPLTSSKPFRAAGSSSPSGSAPHNLPSCDASHLFRVFPRRGLLLAGALRVPLTSQSWKSLGAGGRRPRPSGWPRPRCL